MADKITVAEWRAYIADPNWVGTQYIDDSAITVGGMEIDDDSDDDVLSKLDQSAQVRILAGVVEDEADRNYCVSLRTHFRNWRESRSHRTIVALVKVEDADRIIALIEGAGGKIQ